MIGIYKITSPSGRIYIGQSKNINKRFNRYLNKKCKGQPKIYNSFIKYGVENHKFETIEECLFEQLNIRERYWQDYYDVLGENGLNCLLTKTDLLPKVISNETIKKMSDSHIGNQSNLGNKHSEESKLKMSKSHLGKPISEELKMKLLKCHLGKKMPEHVKKAISISNMGKKASKETKLKQTLIRCNVILDVYSGVYYYGIQDLSLNLGINHGVLKRGITNKLDKFNRYIITK